MKILTQQEVVIDLSRPAMQHLVDTVTHDPWQYGDDVKTELYNFRNMLQNLLERSEPETENLDLIGE